MTDHRDAEVDALRREVRRLKEIMGAVDDPEFAEYDRLRRKFEGE